MKRISCLVNTSSCMGREDGALWLGVQVNTAIYSTVLVKFVPKIFIWAMLLTVRKRNLELLMLDLLLYVFTVSFSSLLLFEVQ
jgi:hypothetical protein